MNEVNAAIITIGDELLIGQTIDTNSAFIAQELNKTGIWVKRRIAIGDVKEEIMHALEEQSKDCQVIIITGGLGPTADDVTKPALCEYFGSELIVDEDALQNVKDIFKKLNRPLIERNLKQAEVPDNCVVLQNKRGTAPGMWFEARPPLAPPTGENNAQAWLKKDSSELPDEVSVGEFYQEADPFTYKLLKNFVAEHRKFPTEAENILWEQLRGNKLDGYNFRRQHIIGNFIVDFICLAKKLIIEVDGLIHQLPENKLSDEERRGWLSMKGYTVIRVTNEEILFNLENSLDTIKKKLSDIPFIQKKSYEPLKTGYHSDESPPSKVSAADPSPVGGSRMGAVFVSLPGVPHEMKGLMLDSVIPKLKETFQLPVVLHRTLLTSGIGESMLADHIADFENGLPAHVKLAYLPAYGMVRLRLTARGSNREKVAGDLDRLFEPLKSLAKEWLVADEDISLQEALIKLLKSKSKTLSTAESCTGGNIAHLLTSIAGSSAVYYGSIISYANSAKENLLAVKEETLRQFGAVSEETVTEMVAGALHELQTDYAIATSGIMGPDGGTPEKPVGTVWIAVGNKDQIKTTKAHFRFDRERNIELTSHTALTMLYKFILEN